jgi:hypothetical protein
MATKKKAKKRASKADAPARTGPKRLALRVHSEQTSSTLDGKGHLYALSLRYAGDVLRLGEVIAKTSAEARAKGKRLVKVEV